MRAQVFIHAAAVATPLGDLDAIWRAWLAGDPVAPQLASGAGEWRGRTGAVAEEIARGLLPGERASTGLILATTKGNMEEQVRWMRRADGEVGAVELCTLGGEAAALARVAGVGGAAYAVSMACASGVVALVDAALGLLDGEAGHMIALAADDASSFVRDGFHALRAISPGVCRPFDRERRGLILGSAAAGMLLGLSPRGGSKRPAVVITGFGVSNDATHMTAPDPTAAGLIRAIEQALEMAKLRPADIDVLLAHGTGTRYNDAMEAVAIRKIFLKDNRKGPAVTAVKSLIGHTLGAAGLIEAALGVRILEGQVVPKIIHMERAEDASIDFVSARREMRVRHLLKTASGFGGVNAAIVLSVGVG